MKYTTGKFFLDTNFLLYCFSKDEHEKREICMSILVEGKEKAIFVLSTQVIKEFTSVMLSKYKVDPLIVKQIISDFKNFEIVKLDLPLIKEGIEIHSAYKYSFWDSLIVAAARAASCNYVLTEDMQHAQELFGLTIWDPFHSKKQDG